MTSTLSKLKLVPADAKISHTASYTDQNEILDNDCSNNGKYSDTKNKIEIGKVYRLYKET